MNVRSWGLRFVATLLLPTLAWVGTPAARAAEEKSAAETKAGSEKKAEGDAKTDGAVTKKPVKKAPADYRGPLPFYYGKVIAPDQKEKIYAIQDKYEAELAPLQKQIKEMMAKRDAEIDAILTPEQREKVATMKAEAKSKAPSGKKPVAKSDASASKEGVKPKPPEKKDGAEASKSGN